MPSSARLRRARNLLLLLPAALTGCRDTTDVFSALDRQPASGDVIQLTFSDGDDRFPAWSTSSDTVFYSGFSGDFAPDAPATILAVHRTGGVARQVLSNAQGGVNAQFWLMAPAFAPDGERIAYVHLSPLRPRLPCIVVEVLLCPTKYYDPSSIRLDSAVVRVRPVDALNAPQTDPSLAFDYADPITAPPVESSQTWRTEFVPFQAAWRDTRDYPTRASWAPDGLRLATSDGTAIVVWTPDTGLSERVPGTEDGTAAAWSPDGEWIAYTWTERVDSTESTCGLGMTIPRPHPLPDSLWMPCYEHRVEYVTATPRIVLVRADGSGREVVGDGQDPAWTPDGRLVFAYPGDSTEDLRIHDPADGSLVFVPGTAGGREPAVSPDGQWVAYSVPPAPRLPRNIYVARMP